MENKKGPPDQVAVAESEEMVAAEGVDAARGEASKSIHIIIETIVSSLIERIVFGKVVFIVFPFGDRALIVNPTGSLK